MEGKWVCEGTGRPCALGEETARKYLRDIVSGLTYLHAHVLSLNQILLWLMMTQCPPHTNAHFDLQSHACSFYSYFSSCLSLFYASFVEKKKHLWVELQIDTAQFFVQAICTLMYVILLRLAISFVCQLEAANIYLCLPIFGWSIFFHINRTYIRYVCLKTGTSISFIGHAQTHWCNMLQNSLTMLLWWFNICFNAEYSAWGYKTW